MGNIFTGRFYFSSSFLLPGKSVMTRALATILYYEMSLVEGNHVHLNSKIGWMLAALYSGVF